MNILEELNEKLRETCCMGDVQGAYKCLSQGADINSKNKMNGWTSLHWAAKRGHTSLVETLLKSNADPYVLNDKEQTAFDVADSQTVKDLLSESVNSSDRSLPTGQSFKPIQSNGSKSENEVSSTVQRQEKSSFIPSYMVNPVFPYVGQSGGNNTMGRASEINSQRIMNGANESDELVLKLREANSAETDFIEIELYDLTFSNLTDTCIKELGIDMDSVRITKIRKLPNTILRKDNDVKRLTHLQDIEICTEKLDCNH